MLIIYIHVYIHTMIVWYIHVYILFITEPGNLPAADRPPGQCWCPDIIQHCWQHAGAWSSWSWPSGHVSVESSAEYRQHCPLHHTSCQGEPVAMFQWKVLQNIDNIVHYITHLVKVSQWPCFSRKVLRKMDAEHSNNLTISHVFSRLRMLWLVSM